MSTFKRCGLGMLPANEKAEISDIYLTSSRTLAKCDYGTLHLAYNNVQHLYIFSNEEIKKDDLPCWAVNKNLDVVYQIQTLKGSENWNKIIATTDSSLEIVSSGINPVYEKLPQPSQSFVQKFVEEYNKGNIITEVLVEYESYHGINTSIAEINYVSGDGSLNWQGIDDLRDFKLKVNPIDNTITIKKRKYNWSREELKKLFDSYGDNLLAKIIWNDIENL